MDELFLEKVQPNMKSRFLNNAGVEVKEAPTDPATQREIGTYFDFSFLDGFSYTSFRIKFFDVVREMRSYGFKAILIPLDDWISKYGDNVYSKPNNPIYNIISLINKDYKAMKRELKDVILIFSRNGSWFALHVNTYDPKNYTVFLSNMETLCFSMTNTSKKAAATGIVPPVPPTRIDIDQSEEENEELKDELVDTIARKAEDADSVEDFYDANGDDERIMQIIQDISDDEYGKPKFSSARAARITKVNDAFVNSKTSSGKTLKELIEHPENRKELPKTNLSKKVASINSDDWENIQYINFNKEYDLDEDVRLILASFANKEYPLVVRDVQMEDTSTSEDYVVTYTVAMEDSFGKQFTLKFDMPKFVNYRFMRLRGNDKVISGQLFNLPCTKTDKDTVQVVSNYRKIMISRYGATGKTYPASDRLIKALNKYEGRDIKISRGDNSRVCDKYELPVDYIDFAMQFNWVETKKFKFYFDQDYYTSNYTVDRTHGKIPLCINKETNSIIYSTVYEETDRMISEQIVDLMLSDSPGLVEMYNAQKPATKHVYSRASIMSAKIPMIVVLGNSVPFTDILKRAGIEYTFSEKRVKYDPDRQGCIRFADGFLIYKLTYSSSMLLNGLYDCDTESYNFIDLNKKSTWLDYLDNFGGRIKADGLDNFKEVFMDPITQEVCRDCGVPTDYIDILIYANSMLADNKYIKHTDLSSNRYRTSEIVAGHLYQVLADEYIKYRAQAKRNRKSVSFSVKRSAVIDAIFTNPVTSDLSSMSPLLEEEANNSATFKGLSGLNADRAYSLDKRTYDESMVGKLALSTGFSTNVGINRQTTIDMDIQGKRGYIKKTDPNTKSVTKRLSITEATTPFGSTRDDPFRTAMTYIQTSKHSMPTKCGMPLLVTNGSDEALAYMVSDNYIYRAEEEGTVTELIPDDHMIVKYKSGKGQYISLKEETRKNSDGGFYMTIQMTTNLKKDQKFKQDDILAWDKRSFSNRNGETDHLAANIGVLAYCAIMATDEGFEDSTAVSEWLSEAMGSEVCAMTDVELAKMTNVYSMVKVGQPIQEGDPLIIFQNSFDQEDANILLKNITDQDFVSDLGRIRIKAKYTGIVQDIKIYRTCEIEELSESLQRIIKKYDAGIDKTRALYKKNNIPGTNTLEPTTAMPPAGKLKNTDGVRIEFYIKYFDNLGIADKVVAQSANKGVVKAVFPKGEEPYSSFDPSKTIHAVFSSRSFNARMVTSPIVSGAINKGLVNLDEQVKKIMGIKPMRLEDIQG